MRKAVLILFFIAFQFFAVCQGTNGTKVFGTVKLIEKKLDDKSYPLIMYDQHDSLGGNGISSSINIYNGKFEKIFPKNTKVQLSTYFDDFYKSDTTIFTSTLNEIRIDFVIYPKLYKYTEELAEQDIHKKMIQFVTFDSTIYNWNQVLHFSDEFGFKYILQPKPDDYDFEKNISLYNWKMENYLDSNNFSWKKKINFIKDSLINLEADNYGKSNTININELHFPENALLSERMKLLIRNQEWWFNNLFKKEKKEYLGFSKDFILNKIDNDSDYNYLFIAEYWMAFNYEKIIPELIKRLTNKKEVGLINTADLIIDERIKSGDLQYWGHGAYTDDDLFTVAGRANHLLRTITGNNFGNVSMYSNDYNLKKLQNRWAFWLMNLKILK